MKLNEEGLQVILAASLVAFLAIFAVYLWFIDLISRQREFGSLLATELVAFSMLAYIATRPNYAATKKAWILSGCVALIFLLASVFLS